MKVFTGRRDESCAMAAAEIARLVNTKPDCVLALSASESLLGIYSALLRCGADFSQCTVFLTEEFAGIDEFECRSRYARLRAALDGPGGVPAERIYFPAASGDLDAECAAYDGLMADAGGIDLALLAIGGNGRIAFNEPLTQFDSSTHVGKLTEVTREEEGRDFGSDAPEKGVTLGIRSIMRSKRVVLAAFGGGLADTVHSAVSGRPHISVPASLLQLHDNVQVYLDEGSASLLS